MNISDLLCVGRGSPCNVGYELSEERLLKSKTASENLDLSEQDLISKMHSTAKHDDSLLAQTRPILRSKIPCPRHGSPSGVRSVRFSDRDSDNEAVFAKIHVNEQVQTESPKKLKNTTLSKDNLELFVDKLKENKEKLEEHEPRKAKTYTPCLYKATLVQEPKTSIPRFVKGKTMNDQEKPFFKDSAPIAPKTSTPRFEKRTPAPDFRPPSTWLTDGQKSPRTLSPARPSKVHSTVKQFEKISNHVVSPATSEVDTRHISHGPEHLGCQSDHKTKTFTIPLEHKGRLVVDINIDKKKSAEEDNQRLQETAIPKIVKGSPKRLFKADKSPCLDANEDSSRITALSPERRETGLPDGSRIIRNLDLSDLEMKFKSTASQTGDSTLSSPRSSSPVGSCTCQDLTDGKKIIQNMELDSALKSKSESMTADDIPDGRKIIQNMEFGTFDKSLQVKSKAVQTTDFPDGHKIVQNLDHEPLPKSLKSRSVDTQTYMAEEEPFKDVPTQVDFEDSPEGSPDSSIEEPGTRSIAIQVAVSSRDEIDDGKKIVKNLEISKQGRHLHTRMPDSESYVSVGRSNNSTLNDGNWNEFVHHLKLFNPSSSSSSASSFTGEEPPPSPRSDPVLVYNKDDSTRVNERQERQTKVDNALSDRNARSYIRSETFKKDKYESVLKEEGLLQKLKDFKYPLYSKEQTDKFVHRSSPDHWKPPLTDFKSKIQHTKVEPHLPHESGEESSAFSKKESLGFTPIETYSFNPDSLLRTTTHIANKGKSNPKPSKQWSPTHSTSSEKESISKNAFIRGFDLGPAPKTSSMSRYTSLFKDADNFKTTTSKTNSNLGTYTYMQHKPTSTSFSGAKSPFVKPWSYSSDDSFLQKRSPSIRPSSHYQRPLSAPFSIGKYHGSSLTPSLKDMRSSAARKSAMGLLSHRQPLIRDRPVAYHSKPSISSCQPFSKRAYSPKRYSKHSPYCDSTFRPKEYDVSNKKTTDIIPKKDYNNFSSACKFRTHSEPRQVSSDKPTYLESLEAESNQRPPSRDRSRSRSRSRSPKPSDDTEMLDFYKTKYKVSQTSLEDQQLDKEDDSGCFESFVAKGSQRSPKLDRKSETFSVKDDNNISRESRSVARKPPLPNHRKNSRSRSRSKSADRFVSGDKEETSTLRKPERDKENLRGRSPVLKERLPTFRKYPTKPDPGPEYNLNVVTIGHVPAGVENKESMYLGHDSIQKIIDEAKL